jgi:hypothetical protein
MFSLLLNLKSFLRKAYNLSETRITEYLPSEKERLNEKGISIAEGTPRFSATIASIYNGDEINWNSAIRTYATFRILMREGGSEELHYDEDQNQKKGRKRKKSDVPENSPAPPQNSSQVSPESA